MCQNVYHDLIVRVYYDGQAYVDSDSCFTNIDKWNELATYRNQEPSLAGDLVLILSGHLLLLDVSSQILDQLQVRATLYFKTDAIFLYVAWYLRLVHQLLHYTKRMLLIVH